MEKTKNKRKRGVVVLFEIIQNNFVAVAITLFLLLFILTNNNFENRINRLFLAAVCCVLILIVEEVWEAQLARGTTFTPLRIVLSAIGYTLRPLVPFFLTIMIKKMEKKTIKLLSIPLIFNTVVAFSALFCKISFGYTQDNEFVRGPLGYTPFVVASFYICILLTFTIMKCSKEGLMEAMIVSAIVLLAFMSTIMESVFHFQFIQNPSIATSITFFYLFLHSNRNNRDPLTGALTRRRFYLDAEKFTSTLTAVVSIDLNDLKKLNDQYGHLEGDKALVAITDIMKKNSKSSVSFYRTGGDEFMMLCHRMNEESVQKMLEKIREELEKTRYRCAMGYALYSKEQDFESVCQIADQMMYENKRQMKRAVNEENR